jgi:hypothetical protein
MAIISIPDSLGGVAIPGITNVPGGPLGVLFGTSRYDIAAYKYPKDLSSATKGHYIHFTINKVEPLKASAQVTNSIKTGIENTLGSTGIIDTAVSAISGAFDTAQTFGKSLYGAATDTSFTQRTKTPIKTIALYMPDTVAFPYAASYGQTSLKDVAVAATSAIPGIGKLTSTVSSIADSPVTKLLLNTAGLAINPKEQVLFDGITFRTYQLAFTFTPTSRDEAIEVRNIIKELRSAAAPTINSGKAGMFYDIPNTFDIDFLFNGVRNRHITKVAESVLESIDVNYAPNGWSAHNDGAPVQTTLTLNFKEIELIDKNMINQGY